jgi:hypothetical protein
MGGGVVVAVTMTAPNGETLLTFDSTVGAGEADLNMGNNHASIKTTVSNATPDMPVLYAARKNDQLVLSWQGSSTNIVLQSSTFAGLSGSWSNLSYTPVVSNGVSTVTVPTTGSTKFFRLRRTP